MLLNRVTVILKLLQYRLVSENWLWCLLTEGEMTEVYAEPIQIEVTEVRQVS